MPYMFWREASRQKVLRVCNHKITTLCYFVIWREWKRKRDFLVAYAAEFVTEIALLTEIEGEALLPQVVHQIG